VLLNYRPGCLPPQSQCSWCSMHAREWGPQANAYEPNSEMPRIALRTSLKLNRYIMLFPPKKAKANNIATRLDRTFI
jgi:hypothetical protein